MNNTYSIDEDINLSTDISIVQCTEFGLNLEVIKHADSIWMTKRQIAELYDRHITTIEEHIKNIFKDGKLDENLTTGDFPIVAVEGGVQVKRNIKHYNIDVILEIGLRVTSDKGKKLQEFAKTLTKQIMKNVVNDTNQLSNEILELKKISFKIRICY